ncbi:MAG: esterase [Acidimicrobiia bacterium]|nr:esterase [Acidimicrobiia bacterium]
MQIREHTIETASGPGKMLVFGHWGQPLLAFPSEAGNIRDWEWNGMIGAVSDLVEAGRVKIYAVPSFDSESWSKTDIPTEERARRHGPYEDWIMHGAVPFIFEDQGGETGITVAGPSLGAVHAANFCLKHGHYFSRAICLSGMYDVASLGWGEYGDAAYFNDPLAYVANLEGDHLSWLRGQISMILVVGSGQWEDTTGANESTHRFGALLAEKAIPHEMDVWDHNWPHDWPSWRAQIAHHLPRFV